MAEIDKNPTHRAQFKRNPFDMSMIRKFTSSVGLLLPVYYDFLSPGEKVNYSCEMFTRTQPLTSPAFVKFTNHVDWFFVPTNQLYQFFGDRQFGINDLKTNLVVQANVTRDVPLASVSDIADVVTSNVGSRDSNTDLDIGVSMMRLLDLLGYSSRSYAATSLQSTNKVNTLLLQAYQKIYSDVYRLSDRQSALTYVYNLDSYSNTDVSQSTLAELLNLRTRSWKKDLFTNLFPAPLINGGSTGMLDNAALQNVNDWLSNSSSVLYQNPKPNITNNRTVGSTDVYESGSGTVNVTAANAAVALRNVVSTSNIRSMFAVEKLAEITRRAPKHYDAQVLAHFGFDVPVGISGEVYRLGSDSSVFQIGDVISTSDTLSSDGSTTTGQPLGEMAGKGISYGNGNKKSFTAPCHGVLMAIYSCVPEADYDNTGMDRLNTYSKREDFYQPEFDRLGMQPCFYYQRYFVGNSPAVDAQILGWQYRYSELKQKFNVANGGFNETLTNWTTRRNTSPNGTLKDFLIPSTYLNPIMSVNFDSNDEKFSSDPLLNMFQFNVVKFSQMSTYGLPNL